MTTVDTAQHLFRNSTLSDFTRVKGINKFIARFVDPAGSILITDEYSGYNRVSETMLHAVVNHAREYANGHVHTNTIEGFWAIVKRQQSLPL